MKTAARLAARVDAALLTLLVGFAFSMAANLLWTWQGGVVRILGGALASLALPGAIHLWPRIPIAAPVEVRVWRWTFRVPVMRAVRGLAMTGIAAMAAFTTFSHASALLIQHGEDPLLATLYPVMTELLVVMGVLARHSVPVSDSSERAPVKPKPTKTSVGTAAPPAVPTEPTPTADDKPGVEEWAAANWPTTGAAIQLATGCSKGYAYKVAAKLREQPA